MRIMNPKTEKERIKNALWYIGEAQIKLHEADLDMVESLLRAAAKELINLKKGNTTD